MKLLFVFNTNCYSILAEIFGANIRLYCKFCGVSGLALHSSTQDAVFQFMLEIFTAAPA